MIKSTPIYGDPNRNAKKYKILPHRYLAQYDYSVWIDGNILIVNDIRDLVTQHKYQVFDHNQTQLDPRDCIYKEYDAIMRLGQQNGGNSLMVVITKTTLRLCTLKLKDTWMKVTHNTMG